MDSEFAASSYRFPIFYPLRFYSYPIRVAKHSYDTNNQFLQKNM